MKSVRPFLVAGALTLSVLPVAGQAEPLSLVPRSALEAIVLGDATQAKAHLEALAGRERAERDAVVGELLAAGFAPDRGTPECDFYGYYRNTTIEGAARSVQVALCSSGKPMVLVLDMLAPGAGGTGFSEHRKGHNP